MSAFRGLNGQKQTKGEDPVTPELSRLRQKKCEFETTLGYTVRLCPSLTRPAQSPCTLLAPHLSTSGLPHFCREAYRLFPPGGPLPPAPSFFTLYWPDGPLSPQGQTSGPSSLHRLATQIPGCQLGLTAWISTVWHPLHRPAS